MTILGNETILGIFKVYCTYTVGIAYNVYRSV
jgi:hypothetical protein